jgi:hypothetical protein
MEVWQAVFRNLYTGFLLRDFAGKIVPGVLLLFSICSMYREPRKLFDSLTKDVSTFTLIFVAGFAWIFTLGTQSLAEGLGIWRYFPDDGFQVASGAPKIALWRNLFTRGDDSSFDKDTLNIDDFQSKASEEEKQQYERFVVIKEACGNLFVAGLFAIPAWLYVIVKRVFGTASRSHKYVAPNYVPAVRSLLGAIYIFFVMVGLHRMHAQHVHRQYQYAADLVQKHKDAPEHKPMSLHLDLEETAH